MSILILVGRDAADQKRYVWFIDRCRQSLTTLAPELDVRVFPDIGKIEDIDFVLTWRPPLGLLKTLPNLKVIASLGAGIDHVISDPEFPKQVILTRVKDPHMAQDIAHYVLANVLYYAKRLDYWQLKQQQKIWSKEPPFQFTDQSVGIMGMGYLGLQSAYALRDIHMPVAGWSGSPKELADINHFVGDDNLKPFLQNTFFLVCLLPLTKETHNILNIHHFALLPKGAYLIHLGRGEQLAEEDLLQALDSGQLAGACLDVFRQEPLPVDHPFWHHPKIRITPHVASVTDPATAIPQILENYRRYLKKSPLLNQVDLKKGY